MNASKRYKVCHFASVHTTTDTRVFHRECVSLAEHFDVTYIGIGNKSEYKNGVNIIGIPKPQSRVHRLFFTTWKVFVLAWKQHADIYHIHDAELIPFAALLRLKGKKVIYDIHENTYEDIMHKPWIHSYLRWILAFLFKILEWIASHTMSIVLVIARPEFAQKFTTYKRSVIVQNFATFSQFTPYRNTQRKELPEANLFYMGTVFDYYYDLIPVVNALYILQQKGLIINFHCVGYTGSYIEDVLSKTEYYQAIKHQLHFYGYMSSDKGYLISKTCKVGLCLKNQPEKVLVSHERKFFEYMAAGLPILSCNHHIYKEVIDTCSIGRYVDLTDEIAIANVLQELFFGNADLDQYASNGVSVAESTFNWELEKQKLIDLYYSLTAGRA